MNSRITRLFLVLFAALLAAGLVHLPAQAAPGELVVIVNRRNPTRSLSGSEVESLFTLSRKSWSHGGAVIPFNHTAGSPVREAFDRAVLRMDPTQVAKFWIDQRIRGIANPPRQVPSVALMLAVVARLEGAVGYVPAEQVTDQVKVVARIARGEVVDP